MCDQQSLRSACAYAQSDQNLCLSLECSMSVKLLTEHHLEFLRLKEGCTGSSECIHVKMPHCWKSHVAAHFNILTQVEIESSQMRLARTIPKRRLNYLKSVVRRCSTPHPHAYMGSARIDMVLCRVIIFMSVSCSSARFLQPHLRHNSF